MHDIAIIGGGINGCGIARDAAGRGLSVLLVEKNDLASGTSSASTKLIHGGLRYLEQYNFRLVRESLREREVLLRIAPHVVRPLRFVLPHHRGLRPAYLIRLGLLLYDHLGARRILPRSTSVNLTHSPFGAPLKPGYTRGFEYSDCWVDDARLVVLNAMDAATRGADIRVRTEVMAAVRGDGHWQVDLRDTVSGRQDRVQARVLINASGAWIAEATGRCLTSQAVPRARLVKGSHIVVPKLFDHDRAYIFQNADRRIVFAIPYETDYTLIGTTDVDFRGDLAHIAISQEEVVYLCQAANEYFARSINPVDVVWSYAGVRSLQDDGRGSAQDTTRDFALLLDGRTGEPPLLSVVGGKITTYRQLAEQAIGMLPVLRSRGQPWTGSAPLPGGDFAHDGRDKLARNLAAGFPALGTGMADRIARTYGAMAWRMFDGVVRREDMGVHFGADLYEREVMHLVKHEWAMTAEDILWRRTKLGLRVTDTERSRLSDWLSEHSRDSTSAA